MGVLLLDPSKMWEIALPPHCRNAFGFYLTKKLLCYSVNRSSEGSFQFLPVLYQNCGKLLDYIFRAVSFLLIFRKLSIFTHPTPFSL